METYPGPRRPVPAVFRILCSNVQSLAGNHSDLTVTSSQYVILLCSETLVSDMRHLSEILVPGFGRPVLLGRVKMHRAGGMAAYVGDGYGAFCQPKFECWSQANVTPFQKGPPSSSVAFPVIPINYWWNCTEEV